MHCLVTSYNVLQGDWSQHCGTLVIHYTLFVIMIILAFLWAQHHLPLPATSPHQHKEVVRHDNFRDWSSTSQNIVVSKWTGFWLDLPVSETKPPRLDRQKVLFLVTWSPESTKRCLPWLSKMTYYTRTLRNDVPCCGPAWPTSVECGERRTHTHTHTTVPARQ